MLFQDFVSKWIHKFYSESNASENFFTLPQISDILAIAIISKIRKELPNAKSLLDLGAGDGDLSYSIMKHSEKLGLHIEKIFLVEFSEIRKKKIKDKFKLESKKIEIIDTISDFKGKVDVVIANEFFDSLPFSVIMYDGSIKELFLENTNFFFSQITQASTEYIRKYIDLEKLLINPTENPIIFEIYPMIIEYVNIISQISDMAIISDYGYRYFYHRNPYGSVIIHKKYKTEKMNFLNLEKLKHQVSDNFGKSDISFFVDFDILEKIFEEKGFLTDTKRLSSFLLENLEGNEIVFSSKENLLGTIDALCNWGNFFTLTALKINNTSL